MKVETVVQSKRRLPKLFSQLRSFAFPQLHISPWTPAVVTPPIVVRDFLRRPPFGVFLSVREMQDETHSPGGVGDLAHFSSVEDLHVVGVGRCAVAGRLAHPRIPRVENDRLTRLATGRRRDAHQTASQPLGEDELEHHAAAEVEGAFCVVQIDQILCPVALVLGVTGSGIVEGRGTIIFSGCGTRFASCGIHRHICLCISPPGEHQVQHGGTADSGCRQPQHSMKEVGPLGYGGICIHHRLNNLLLGIP
mmetsp:Transcript_55556/g.92315  ORF Transcript_55556/g.92315 Transcript_55556/m.92315 type:complete len:250 (+) Transcript_55556:288-1037(+)